MQAGDAQARRRCARTLQSLLDILVLFTPCLNGLLYTRTGALLLLLPTRRLELPNPTLLLSPTLHADALSSPTKPVNFSTLHNAHI